MAVSETALPGDLRRMSAELSGLARQQSEALQSTAYANMSQAEANVYNLRHLRIGELSELLAKSADL
jgi:hypothetical protein